MTGSTCSRPNTTGAVTPLAERDGRIEALQAEIGRLRAAAEVSP
jgi:uncharacterized small protein (DUF1192 family)